MNFNIRLVLPLRGRYIGFTYVIDVSGVDAHIEPVLRNSCYEILTAAIGDFLENPGNIRRHFLREQPWFFPSTVYQSEPFWHHPITRFERSPRNRVLETHLKSWHIIFQMDGSRWIWSYLYPPPNPWNKGLLNSLLCVRLFSKYSPVTYFFRASNILKYTYLAVNHEYQRLCHRHTIWNFIYFHSQGDKQTSAIFRETVLYGHLFLSAMFW